MLIARSGPFKNLFLSYGFPDFIALEVIVQNKDATANATPANMDTEANRIDKAAMLGIKDMMKHKLEICNGFNFPIFFGLLLMPLKVTGEGILTAIKETTMQAP